MATPLIPQEIYLLERYSPLGYFGQMRDAWQVMLNMLKICWIVTCTTCHRITAIAPCLNSRTSCGVSESCQILGTLCKH